MVRHADDASRLNLMNVAKTWQISICDDPRGALHDFASGIAYKSHLFPKG